ncbi:MAG: PQQ-binding-like beta-propeller repeat protein [Planctomycetaceae bacterium]|jgi:outer membrane protein assembly factor BamB|nr:PQQ-binding-like beta-propeller repeat protein [Planctomycetaceae bacterium]
MPLNPSRLVPFTLALLLCTMTAHAGNWPNWRGPTQNGVSTETGIPAKFGPKQNVAWQLALPGPAGATPVVWGRRVFLTSIDGQKLVLMCVGTDGKLQWRHQIGTGNKVVRGDEGNSASPSPVTDGKHVWAMMANGQVSCHTVAGKPVWNRDLRPVYGPFKIAFGLTASLILDEGKVFLQLIHGSRQASPDEDQGLIVALDAATGKQSWKQVRRSDAYDENKHSYTSPFIYNDGKKKLLISHGADYTIAYRLGDGAEVWRKGGLNPQNDPKKKYHRTLRFVASPTAVPGLIVIPTAKNGPVVAIRPDGKGDISNDKSQHVWTRPNNTPDVPCPLIHDGLVYLCRENGNLVCMDAKTGKEFYHERTHRQRHRASPIYVDGKIICVARDGMITVARAGKTFEILARNNMGDSIAASPAIANGTLYLRSFKSLWAIRKP